MLTTGAVLLALDSPNTGEAGNVGAGTPKATGRPTQVMGYLWVRSIDGASFVLPEVAYADGRFETVRTAPEEPARDLIDRVRRAVAIEKTWWLFKDGLAVGCFEATGTADLTEDYVTALAVTGRVRWKGKPPESSYGIVALSRRTRQDFTLSLSRLDERQNRQLDALLDEGGRRTDLLVAKRWALLGRPGRPIVEFSQGRRSSRAVQVMDLNRDGRLEVFATAEWRVPGCESVGAQVVATWSDGWRPLLEATQARGCQGLPWAGDEQITEPTCVDLDGDGKAEVLVHFRHPDPAVGIVTVLYAFEDGRLVKRATVGVRGE